MRRWTTILPLAFGLIAGGPGVEGAPEPDEPIPVTVKVDFGASGHPVADGFIDLSIPYEFRPQWIEFIEDDGLPQNLSVFIETSNPADNLSFLTLEGGPLCGDFILPDNLEGGLVLKFSGLAAGSHVLTTYHNTSDTLRSGFDVYVDGQLTSSGHLQTTVTDDSQAATVRTEFALAGDSREVEVEFQPTSSGTGLYNRAALNAFVFEGLLSAPPPPEPPQPQPWKANPYLFVDDDLIVHQENLIREVNPPQRLPDPIVTGWGADTPGSGDNNYTPYLTVVRDAESGRFRMWYNTRSTDESSQDNRSHLAYMESEDGIQWIRPHRVLEDPIYIQFGASIIDEGPDYSQPDERYKFGFYGGTGGLHVAVSDNGLDWRMSQTGPVVVHNHDINSIYKDPLRDRYLALISFYIPGPWGSYRRIPYQSTGKSIFDMSRPQRIIAPDERDEGITQFYCMSGLITRGELLIGLVRILRDDLFADPEHPEWFGIGYTTLAYTRDGEEWVRDAEPFMDRNPQPGTFDHAMTWGDCQILVGDETYIYYGGYKSGHKWRPFTERQIGFAWMARDRYVARVAGETEGSLRTPVRILAASDMTVNAAVEGLLRVRVLDEQGQTIEGFDWQDGETIRGDAVAHSPNWRFPLWSLRGRRVSFEFRLSGARLFSFHLLGEADIEGSHLPGDCNADGALDIADGICLLGHLFLNIPAELPCGDGTLEDVRNRFLLNSNGDTTVDVSDAIRVFGFLFTGAPPPALGTECVPVDGCPAECAR